MVVGRFFTVGLVCAVTHNAIMIGGDWAGLHYVVSSFISFAVVVMLGFWLHSGWTFPDAQRSPGSFARYAGTMALHLPLSIALMLVFVGLAHLPVASSSPLLTGL